MISEHTNMLECAFPFLFSTVSLIPPHSYFPATLYEEEPPLQDSNCVDLKEKKSLF